MDYGNEADDDNQNGIDDTNKSETNNLDSNSVQSNTEIAQKNQEPTAETIDTVPANTINEITDEDPPILVEPIIEHRDDFAESSSCDVNNGGCEHICTMVPDEEIGANIVECSCQIGFYLDDEGQKCLGKFIILLSYKYLSFFLFLRKKNMHLCEDFNGTQERKKEIESA